MLNYKSNVFCLFSFLYLPPSLSLPPSFSAAQMNRPIQVKPADSESRGGDCQLLFFILSFRFLPPPSCHSESASPLPVDVPFLGVIFNDATRRDPTVVRDLGAGPRTTYINAGHSFCLITLHVERTRGWRFLFHILEKCVESVKYFYRFFLSLKKIMLNYRKFF